MLELVRDGVLTIKDAAARKHMSVEEFQRKIQELKLRQASYLLTEFPI